MCIDVESSCVGTVCGEGFDLFTKEMGHFYSAILCMHIICNLQNALMQESPVVRV